MGFLDNLLKSPQQKEEESRQYYAWAYPYGEAQKEKIDALVREFVSDEDKNFSVYNYLVARQELTKDRPNSREPFTDDEFYFAAKALKKAYIAKGKKDVHKYLALCEADLFIDSRLEYPSIEQLEKRSQEIMAIITK